MPPTPSSFTLSAVIRRFPLLGRPRPSCPALPERVQEVADIAYTAGRDGADGLAEGAHALNKAALIASDCGLPDLARELCWLHIDVYRTVDRPLVIREARHMLEPVLNLARLQLRARDGDHALRLLTEMFHAIRSDDDLVLDGRTLPLAHLVGTRAEHHKLHEWIWLHLIGDGIRALALAGRWDDAVAHARAHRGIGRHLMEGRQAVIVAHRMNGDLVEARAALADSSPRHPWEFQVGSCLKVMCTDLDSVAIRQDVRTMVARLVERQPIPGYAFFRAQLGLSVATLADAVDPDAASHVLVQVAEEAIASRDGYAAGEVLRHGDTRAGVTGAQRAALTYLVDTSGLKTGALPDPLWRSLLDSTQLAAQTLRRTLRKAEQPTTRT